MDGQSLDISKTNLEKLKGLFPELFSENQLDWEKLKAAFGDDINFSNERYILNWAGKSEAIRTLQSATTSSLQPVRDQSLSFDTTKNIFIEGENLEVLKILQKSYYGTVKMINIDPPYNTGNDSFIYPDKFSEKKEDYLKRVGDKDVDGNVLRQDLLKKNSKENGHFHSNWLSMMYPRLFLAKNLLREDGVIFVHIDDNEVHNLRIVMNEIFGEENFEGHIHWRRRSNQPNDKTKMIGIVAEHILAFAKNKTEYKKAGVGKVDITGQFSNPDNDPRGEWASKPWKVGSDQSGSKYKIVSPTGKVLDEEWMGEEATYQTLLNDKRIVFSKNGDGLPRKKYFRSERLEEGQCATNWWPHSEFGDNQGANDEMTSLFGAKNIFDNPKPTEVVRGLIQISNARGGDLVLDFFAGSGTLAQAVLELNQEDGEDRKFLLIQYPEEIDKKEEAYEYGYRTIAQITIARIKKVIERIIKSKEGSADNKMHDLGVKIFKLSPSSFKIWRRDEISEQNIIQQLEFFTNPVESDSLPENMLFELMLKSGCMLDEKVVRENNYYVIGGKLVIALEKMDSSVIEEILLFKPTALIALDSLFAGNDKMKTNMALQLRAAGIEFKFI